MQPNKTMSLPEFIAEAAPMMDKVNEQFAAMFGKPAPRINYLRVCGENETLPEAAADAKRHGGNVYLKDHRFIVSTRPIAGSTQVTPIFEPIRPLEVRHANG